MKFYLVLFTLVYTLAGHTKAINQSRLTSNNSLGFSKPISELKLIDSLVFYRKLPVLDCQAQINLGETQPLTLVSTLSQSTKRGSLDIFVDILTPKGEQVFRQFDQVPLISKPIPTKRKSTIKRMAFVAETRVVTIEFIGTQAANQNGNSKDWDLEYHPNLEGEERPITGFFKATFKDKSFVTKDQYFRIECTEPPGG